MITDLRLYVTEHGACTGLERPDEMFPNEADDVAIARAIRICRRCIARPECAELGRSETHGVWGGRLHTVDGVDAPGRPAEIELTTAGADLDDDPSDSSGARTRLAALLAAYDDSNMIAVPASTEREPLQAEPDREVAS